MSALLSYASSLPGKLGELDLAKNISKADGWTKACLAAIGTYGAYQGVGFLYTKYQQRVNDKKRNKKRQENEKSIGDLRRRVQQNPLNESEVQRITHLEFTDLLDELKSGKLRPINALRAFQTQALRAHEKTNCLVEAIVEAEERALQLEKGPRREGLLWGVPVSIKDDVGIKGYDSCAGMIVKAGKPSQQHGVVYQVLLDHGAVPFVKTNVPQTEMSFEPGNPINGLVHNPHDHTRGPAGSSSGEGALIASYGSPLGVGSDFGGSIRVPAHFCGIQGFKPTSERTSWRNMAFDDPMLMIPYCPAWGPMSRDVDGLVQQMRALWEDCHINQYDNSIARQPFDNKEYTSDRKLRIGYHVENPDFPTVSACKRAVMDAVELLKQQGHEVVPWQPPNMEQVNELTLKVVNVMAFEEREMLKYDRIHPTIAFFDPPNPILTDIRGVLDWLVRPMCPWIADKLMLRVTPPNALEFMELAYEYSKFRHAFYDAWMDAKLDAVISPPNVMVAPPLGSSQLLLYTAQYTVLYNLLHYPAGVVKMTDVKQADLHKLDTDYPDTKDQRQRQAKAAMKGSVGLPVGVMIVTPRYQDETCLRVMKLLEDSIRKRS